MTTTPTVRYHMLDTGYCMAWEHQIIRGGQRREIECHALVALIEHPQHGYLLWDAGYAPRMLEATERLPYSIYRRTTPLHIRPEQAAVVQLAGFGLQASDIGWVIISHFHADHIAGLRDFPSAELIATKAGFRHVVGTRGLIALQRGFLPALLPDDAERRMRLLDTFDGPPLPGLGPTHDLFGDGTLQLVALPGHARGQIGMVARTDRGEVLFAADGCWQTRAVRERRPPSRITGIFVDDLRAVETTLDRLHEFAQTCPDVTFIPTHCPEALEREIAAIQRQG